MDMNMVINILLFVCSVISLVVSLYSLNCSRKANSISEKMLIESQKETMPRISLLGELGIESKSKESLMKENTFDFEDKILDCYADDQTVDCITIEIKNNGNSTLEGLVIKKLYILSGKKYDLENSPDGAKKLYCGGSDKAEHFNLSQNEEAKINFPIGDIIAEEENYDDLQTAMQDIWGYTNIIVIMNVEIYSSNDTSYSKCICGEYEKGKVVRPF